LRWRHGGAEVAEAASMADNCVLVTGASGFLGHNLVPILLASGYTVRALVRASSDTKQLLDLGVELVTGDVHEAASVDAAMVGCRYVVHAAGLFRLWGDVRDFERTNVQGTANVLEAACRHGVQKLVHISTAAVAGNPSPGQVIDEDTPNRPADAYQRSKVDGENLVRMFAQTTRLPAVILRPGAFYGPWGRYAFNRLFFEDPLKGLLIQVHWGRRVTFPVFVPDVAHVIVAALKDGRPGVVYTFAGDSLTHRQANRIISRLARIPAWRLNVPAALMLALARWLTQRAERTGREPYYPLNLAGYVFHDWQVASARARRELAFVPTPFEDGARQTLEWYWDAGLFRRRWPSRAPRAAMAAATGSE
jgi:dihydroflavonol-4-reductase